MSGRSDEWKSRCNFPPAAEKLHLPHLTMDWAFPMNGRPNGLGVPDEWAFPSNAMAFPSNGRSDEWWLQARGRGSPVRGQYAHPHRLSACY